MVYGMQEKATQHAWREGSGEQPFRAAGRVGDGNREQPFRAGGVDTNLDHHGRSGGQFQANRFGGDGGSEAHSSPSLGYGGGGHSSPSLGYGGRNAAVAGSSVYHSQDPQSK